MVYRDFPLQIWPYEIIQYIKVHGMVSHEGPDLYPDEEISDTNTDVSSLKIFGNIVYTRPLGRRKHKLDKNVRKGN